MTDRKTLILTGASRGIGHATVKRFSDEGWRIITCSREDVPQECQRDPNWTHHITADLVDPQSVEGFIAEASEILGETPLGALVNNAAVSPKTPFKERLGCLNGDVATWREVFELNLFAPLNLARGFASALRRGEGCIVNITSIAGHQIHPFAGSAYSTSKAALSALTRELAVEFAELGIRVNAVAPGEIETRYGRRGIRGAHSAHPHAPHGPARGGRLGRLSALRGGFRLRDRDRGLRHRRPAPVLSAKALQLKLSCRSRNQSSRSRVCAISWSRKPLRWPGASL